MTCCMNLSDHSESLDWSTQILKDGVKELQVKDKKDWFNGLFKSLGLSGCLLSLIRMGFLIFVVIIVVLTLFPC